MKKKNKSSKLTVSIVKKMGKDGFDQYQKNQELPAIKLTKEEMQHVHGGGLWKDIFGKTFKETVNDAFHDATGGYFKR